MRNIICELRSSSNPAGPPTADKIATIKALRTHIPISLVEAKDLVCDMPVTVRLSPAQFGLLCAMCALDKDCPMFVVVQAIEAAPMPAPLELCDLGTKG